MAWTKAKITAVAVVGVLLAAGTTVTIIKIKALPDYSWEVADPSDRAFTNARPQLTILHTKFAEMAGSWNATAQEGRCMGINLTPEEIVWLAYDPEHSIKDRRTKLDEPLPKDGYDFICNLRSGASNALRQAITAKFGVTYSRQMVETNVLLLSVRIPNAAGLQPATNRPDVHYGAGGSSSTGTSMPALSHWLENRLSVPVFNQTGLTGNFDFLLDWQKPDPKQPSDEGLKKALLDQLGLELTPKIQPIEMLVVEKAR